MPLFFLFVRPEGKSTYSDHRGFVGHHNGKIWLVRIKLHYNSPYNTLLPLWSFPVNLISFKTTPDFVVDPPPGLLLGVPRSHFGNRCSTCAATLPPLQPPLLAANMWASIIHILTWLSFTFKQQLVLVTAPMRSWRFLSLSLFWFYKFTPAKVKELERWPNNDVWEWECVQGSPGRCSLY